MSVESNVHDMCEELSELARTHGLSIAVAESLTAGNLAAHLGRAGGAGEWFRGGVVAYSKAVKHSVLHVPLGPVVCEEAARAMVHAVASMMGANLAVALTGEGGPEPQEDVEAGTVWFGVAVHGMVSAEKWTFDGEPADVLNKSIDRAVRILLDKARDGERAATTAGRCAKSS